MGIERNISQKKLFHYEDFRRSTLRFAQAIRENRAASIAIALYWFWQITLFQSPAAVLWLPASENFCVSRSTLLMTLALSYALLWVLHKSVARIARLRWYMPLVCIFMLVGTAIAAIAPPSRAFETISGIFLGVGSAAFVVELGRYFAKTGTSCSLYIGVAGATAGTAIFVLYDFIPFQIGAFILVASPVFTCALLAKARRRFRKDRYYAHGISAYLHFPTRYAATNFTQGFAFGIMSITLSSFGTHEAASTSTLYALAFLSGSLVLAITSVVLKLDFNHLLYKIGNPLMAVGFVLLCCSPSNAALSGFLFTVGYCYVYIIVTCVNAHFSHDLGASPCWIVSLSTFFLVVGQICAALAADAIPQMLGATIPFFEISAVMAFALPVCSLFFLNEQNTASGWGAIKPGQSGEAQASAAQQLSNEYHLTPREIDVTLLLAKGRNRERVASELGLSRETIKTHSTNAYRKLMVHSQQELIDLVDSLCNNAK